MLNRASPANRDPRNIFGPDRRRFGRHPVCIPASVGLTGSAPGPVAEFSKILNISEDGMCVQFGAPMKIKRLLPLCVELAETRSRIYVVGRVAWSEPDGTTGLRFPDISGASRLELRQWIKANAAAGSPLPIESLPRGETVIEAPSQKTPAPSAPATLSSEWTELDRDLEGCGSNLESALHLIAQRALTLTWATGAAIALIDRSVPSEMVCRARAGSDSPGIGSRLQAGSGFSGECVRCVATITCDNADDDLRVDRQSSRALGIRSIVATPVKHWGEVIGVLEIFSSDLGAFSSGDAAILERLATFIARAVQKADPAEGNSGVPFADEDRREVETEDAAYPSFESFSGYSHPIGRSIALGSFTAICLVAVGWMLAPSIARLWSSTTTLAAPSPSRVQSSPGAYVLLSAAELTMRANQGDAGAQYALAMRYANGLDLPQDFREAKDWFLRAADQGHVAAQGKLAAAFWEGRGVPQDYSKAYYWALLAQAGGDELSQQIVVSSAARLSPVQIAAEQKEADQWLHSHSIGHATQ